MSDTIRLVDYYYVQAPDKPGAAAAILRALQAAGVNLLAFSGFPSARRSQLDFVPADSAAFVKVAKSLKLKLSGRKSVFLLQGDDRVGALVDSLGKLADAKINVTAVDGITASAGQFGAIFWVKPKDLRRAAKALGI